MKRTRKGSTTFLNHGITLRDKLTFSACKAPVTWHFPPITVPPWGMTDPVLAARSATETHTTYDYMRYHCELTSKTWLKLACTEILK